MSLTALLSVRGVFSLAVIAFSLMLLYSSWGNYQAFLVQEQGEEVTVTVVENDALFRRRPAPRRWHRGAVTITVSLDGERLPMRVERRDKEQYSIGARVLVKHAKGDKKLIAMSNDHRANALAALVSAILVVVLLWFGLRR
ncbi:MAG: hypothetical protein IPG74_06760 [Flavobacteriales bacterium]|nr:hypothetical protein [Flavobacteriales bacterium]